MSETALVSFYKASNLRFACRRMHFVPTKGDYLVFNEIRYVVELVEWCLDTDATEAGTKVNIFIKTSSLLKELK